MKKEKPIPKSGKENLIERFFTVNDMSIIINKSAKEIHGKIQSLQLIPVSKQGKLNAYSWKQMKIIKDIFDHYDGSAAEYLRKSEYKQQREEEQLQNLEKLKKEHPLVIDERFFTLSYFPDVELRW